MAEPFIGEISFFGFNFAPRNWAQCNGELVGISQNATLYSLLGTQFGGDGKSTFAYPNFQGRTPVHFGSSYYYAPRVGALGGTENVVISEQQMAKHTHDFNAAVDNADKNGPSTNRNLAVATSPVYAFGTMPLAALAPGSCSFTGGGQSHDNMQPAQVVNFCIALEGIYPSRN